MKLFFCLETSLDVLEIKEVKQGIRAVEHTRELLLVLLLRYQILEISVAGAGRRCDTFELFVVLLFLLGFA